MGDEADRIIEDGIEYSLYKEGGLIACRYCGEDGLHWENFGTKRRPIWRLCTETAKHKCPVAKDPLEGRL